MSIEDEKREVWSLMGQLERRIDRHDEAIHELKKIPEVLGSISKELSAITRRLDDGDRELRQLRTELTANTVITTDVRDAQTAGRVLTNAVKWLAAFILACSVIWGAIYGAAHPASIPLPPPVK